MPVATSFSWHFRSFGNSFISSPLRQFGYSKSAFDVHTSWYGILVGQTFILLADFGSSSRHSRLRPRFSVCFYGIKLMNQDQLGNFWVFREGRKTVNGRSFLQQLLRALDEVSCENAGKDRVIRSLILAGQLESALADVDSSSFSVAQLATDFVADLLVGGNVPEAQTRILKSEIATLLVPEQLTISPPEGFVYYALHPYDFARVAQRVSSASGNMAVIGIRSIGTTLSAVVRSSLRLRQFATERITVRPVGHPYNRATDFNPAQTRWIGQQLEHDAHFLIVDEGPGRSGSSFLSVAEALVRAGVKSDCITLLGSRAVDPSALCADEAASRWSRFHFLSPVMHTYERFKDDFYVGGGEWRNFLGPEGEWPEAWTQMERLKFLSADRTRLFKFEGFGQFGSDVLERATALSRAGFGPDAEDAGDGMISYSVIKGNRPCSSQMSREILRQLADYCAFRAREFFYKEASASQLGEMTRFNLQVKFGNAGDFSPELVDTANPVLVDGRMQPHEWVILGNGQLIKLDGNTHGDDHFFPGPTDIAWDLAGTIVEWSLDQDATDFLLERFHESCGDDVRGRIRFFVLAYAMFRFAYCAMALTTVRGTSEESRLARACQKYERIAAARLSVTAKPAYPTLSISTVEHTAQHLSET